MLVAHPDHPEWGVGQVQSVVGQRVTVNFPHAGKIVADESHISLVLVSVGPSQL